jgi:hypothetical protein
MAYVILGLAVVCLYFPEASIACVIAAIILAVIAFTQPR